VPCLSFLARNQKEHLPNNAQHFHEKLQAEHGIELSYNWVKQALQGAGLVAWGRKRGVHRKRRQRQPLPGTLLHIDGRKDARWKSHKADFPRREGLIIWRRWRLTQVCEHVYDEFSWWQFFRSWESQF
jgi:hypothetical protein